MVETNPKWKDYSEFCDLVNLDDSHHRKLGEDFDWTCPYCGHRNGASEMWDRVGDEASDYCNNCDEETWFVAETFVVYTPRIPPVKTWTVDFVCGAYQTWSDHSRELFRAWDTHMVAWGIDGSFTEEQAISRALDLFYDNYTGSPIPAKGFMANHIKQRYEANKPKESNS